MILLIGILVGILWYVSAIERKLHTYSEITTTVQSSTYQSKYRRKFGGLYETIVQYYFNGAQHKTSLKYGTDHFDYGEQIYCLVNPEKPEEVYPGNAIVLHKRMRILLWGFIIFFGLLQVVDIVQILSMC